MVIVRVPLGLGQAHLDGWGRVPSGQWFGHLWWRAPAITTTGAVRLSLRCAGWLAADWISLAYEPQSTSDLRRLILDGISWPNLQTPWGTFEGHCHGLLEPHLPLTLPSGYQPLSAHYGRPLVSSGLAAERPTGGRTDHEQTTNCQAQHTNRTPL